MMDAYVCTRREYLILSVMKEEVDWLTFFIAMEAVASTAIEHPEWDMDEKKTWGEWEDEDRK